MTIRFLWISVFLTSILSSACNLFQKKIEKSEKILAKVGDEILTIESLQYLFESNNKMADSAVVVKNYIDDWVRKKLLYQTALKYLPQKNIDIEKQLQDYKESLFIYYYEDELIQQKLDTFINQETLDSFYLMYKNNFALDVDVFQLNYIKLPLESQKIDSVIKWIKDTPNQATKSALLSYCNTYATDFYFEDNLWVSDLDLKKKFSLTGDISTIIKTNKPLVYNTNDDNFQYIIKILEFKKKNEIAPLSYIKDELTFSIINHRKKNILNQAYQSIFQDAIENNTFEIYFE